MADSDTIYSVYLSLRGSLTRAVMRIVPPKEVEDIVQETYVRVCEVKNKDAITSPRSYLFKTARNLALNHMQRAETRLSISVENIAEIEGSLTQRPTDATYEEIATNEEFSRFCDAVRHLPRQCRRAFVLKKVYGHSQREIARKMGISENTVEKHIALGIKRCTYFMAQFEEKGHPRGKPANSLQTDSITIANPRHRS